MTSNTAVQQIVGEVSRSSVHTPHRASSFLAYASQGIRPYILLTVLCLSLYLPGLPSIPPTDRDEARYVQATRQMMESKDYVRIRFQDTAREKKPAGIHWLQAISAHTFGGTSAPLWAYRLPSVLGALLAVLLTFHCGAWLLTREAALLGAVILASALVLVAEAHLAKTDATLLAATVAATGLLTAAFARHPLSILEALCLWLALSAGTLLKGPVLPGLIGTTSLALWVLFPRSRSAAIRSLRPVMGIPLYLGLLAPWFIAISIASGGTFLGNAISGDIAPKLVGVHESHGGFPGYYAALLLLTFWPWSLFVPSAGRHTWAHRRDSSVRALVAWLVPAWLVIEIVPTKLPHYSLPLLPPLALLVGAWLSNAVDGEVAPRRLWRILTRAWIVCSGALLVLFVGASAVFGPKTLIFSLPCAAAIVMMVRKIMQDPTAAPLTSVRTLLTGAVIIYVLFFGLMFSGLESFWLSRSLQRALMPWTSSGPIPISLAGYKEPSAVFLLGTSITLGDGRSAATTMLKTAPSIAVVEQHELAAFREAMGNCASLIESGPTIRGFNYSKGKFMTLTLFRRLTPCSSPPLTTAVSAP